MYRFLSLFIVALVLVAPVLPAFAQSTNVTGLPWPPDMSPIDTPFQCADLYDPASVVIDSSVGLSSTVPGVTQTFAGTIQNTNDYPLLNGSLYIKLFKRENQAEDSVGNIDTVVDQQIVAENLMLRAQGELPFSYEWDVPLYAEGGEYYAGFVFVTNGREQYAGLTFSDEFQAESPSFSVVSDTQVAKFDKESVLINAAPYYFRSIASQLDGREVSISATLVNPTDQQKILPLQWNQYAWDASNKDNLRNTKTELITLAPNETKTVSYTPTNQREAVVFITATTQERDAKSILNIRYIRQGVEEARLLTSGFSSFPLTSGSEVSLYGCAYTTGVPALDGTTLRLELADSSGNIIHQYQAETALQGTPSGFGESFTVSGDYDVLTLTAELLRGGVVIDQMVTRYDCKLIDSNSCFGAGGGESWLSSINKTMVSIIGIFLLLGILVFLRLRHRGGHIVAIVVIAISGVAFNPAVSEAKSVTWSETTARHLIQDFTPTTSFFIDNPGTGGVNNFTGYFAAIQDPVISVTYEGLVYNVSAGGGLLTDGASIPVGTQLRFEPKVPDNDDISIGVNYGATINGYWDTAITPPPITCNENDWLSVYSPYTGGGSGDTVGGSGGLATLGSLYLPTSFRTPTIRVEHAGSASLNCDVTNQNCTVTGPGTIDSRFIFEATNGQLFVRESNYIRAFSQPPASTDECRGNNEPVFLTPQQLTTDEYLNTYCFTNPDNASTDTNFRCSQRNIGNALTVAVPLQQITYTFTATGDSVDAGGACVLPAGFATSGSGTTEQIIAACAASASGGYSQSADFETAFVIDDGFGKYTVCHDNEQIDVYSCSVPGGSNESDTFAWQGRTECQVNYPACVATVPTNTAPGAPVIEGPENGVTNMPYDFTFTATDPDGDQLQYGIDWNNDNVVDEWVPSITSYVNTGVTVPADYTWINPGTVTFKALARDTNNLSSGWATHTIVITAALTETADLKINNSDGPLTVSAGDALNIVWIGSNVPSCALYGAGLPGGTVAVTGNTSVPASVSDTYTLVCGGVADTIAVTVVNNAPPAATAVLEAQVNGGAWSTADQTIDPGDTVTLRWSSADATSCTGTNFNTSGATNGNTSVTAPAPASASTFGLTCLSAGGNGTDSLIITTRALPNLNQPLITYSLSSGFNPTTGIYDSVTVTFQTTNDGGSPSRAAASYQLRFDRDSDGYDETKTGPLGLFTVGQTVSRTEVFTNVPFSGNRVEVTVDSANQVTESNESDNVRVLDMTIPPPDPNLELRVDRTPVRRGETVTVSWDTNATYPMNCSVFGPGIGPIAFDPSVDGPTGNTPSQPINAKSEFTLRCIEPTTNTTFTTMAVVETVGEIEEI